MMSVMPGQSLKLLKSKTYFPIPNAFRGPLSLGWRSWSILTLGRLSEECPLISWAHRHPQQLSKKRRLLIPGGGGGNADCLPRAASLPPARPPWEGGSPVHFAGSGILNLRGRADSCDHFFQPEPAAGSSFCRWVLCCLRFCSVQFAAVFFRVV